MERQRLSDVTPAACCSGLQTRSARTREKKQKPSDLPDERRGSAKPSEAESGTDLARLRAALDFETS